MSIPYIYDIPKIIGKRDSRDSAPGDSGGDADSAAELAARLQRRGGPAALIAARWAAEDGRLLSDSPGREHARADDGAHALRRQRCCSQNAPPLRSSASARLMASCNRIYWFPRRKISVQLISNLALMVLCTWPIGLT